MKLSNILQSLRSLLNLTDYIDKTTTGESIKENIHFRGPNVFILACAIIIASVGLNVNSIPVIIGAMLISPVMGPILGFGFGLATYDNSLVASALKNFAIMVIISIVASTLYFLVSPLTLEHPTELLARTNPTLYDVLIALFGGAAGILEISRKKKGTVLAGVAIATALMPPLCTVGYGISVLSGKVILGALYLFLINSTFIALATFLVVKYLKFPAVGSEGKNRAMSGRAVAFILLIIVVPSVLTAVRVVKENNFNIHVSRLVEENKSIGAGFIYDYKVDNSAKPSTVELFLAGEVLTPDQKEVIFARAEKYGILRSQILFHEAAATTPTDNTLAESEIIKGLYEHMEARIRTLEDSIRALNEQLRLQQATLPPALPPAQQATHQAATPAPSDTTR